MPGPRFASDVRTAFVAWLFSLLPLVAAWRGAFLPGAWLVHLVLLPWLVLAAWPRLASGESGASGTPVGPQEGPRGHGIVAVTGWLALAAPGAVVAWAFDGAGSGTGAGAAIGAAIGAVTGEPGPGGASPGPWSAGGVVELVVSLALVVALVAVGELRGKRRSYPLLWAAWVPGFAGLVFALHGVGAGSDVAERGDAGWRSR